MTRKELKEYNDLVCKYNELYKENQELKKQLEELKSTNKVLSEELTKDKILKQDCLTTCCGIPIGDIPKLINQQKEFIEYINEKIDICDGFIDTIRSDLEEISYGGRSCGKTYIANEIMKNEVAKKILEEILSKFKEIIGGKDDSTK